MAGNIKGITIEFRGDATPLQKAIRQVETDLKRTTNELKNVNKALKFSPTSVDLWRQKQQLLTQKIEETKDKLHALEQAQDQMDADEVDKNSEEYRKLQREIIETESQLKHFEAQLREVGQVNLRALGEQFKQIGSKMTDVGKDLTMKVTAPLAAVGAVAAKNFAEVDKTMQLTNSTMGNTAEEAELLNQAMKDAAASSTYGMSDAATATLNFARAGLTAQEAADALAPAMALAAGEGGELDTVSAGLVATINGFHGSFDEAAQYADVFANACNNSALDVNSLSNAMSVAAPVFSAAGYSVKDAALYMGVMANAGIGADKAANSLKTGMSRLISPSKEAAGWMEKLGIEVTNADGSMKDSVTVQQELHDAFAGLSESEQIAAASAIFGKNQMAPWLALINTAPDDVDALSAALDEEGTAMQMQADMMSGFAGSIEQLKSGLDVAATSLGEALAPTIQKVVGWIQQLVNWFNSLSPQMQTAIATIGLIVAAIGPLLVIGGTLMTGIGNILIKVGQLISFIPTLIGFIAGISPVMIAVVAAIAAVIAIGVLLYKNWDEIKAKAVELWNALKEKFEAIKTSVVNAIDSAKKSLTDKWNEIKKGATETWDKIKSAAKTTWDAIKSAITDPIKNLGSTLQEKWNDIKSTAESTWNSIKSTAESVWSAVKKAITDPIEKAKDKVDDAVKKIKDFFPISVGKIIDNIKLPHFSISGKFSLDPPSMPKVSVSWYKQGGLFNSPSLIGVGEAGPEAVVPLDRFWDAIESSNRQTELLLIRQNQILLQILSETMKEKDFKVDGMWAGRYINSMVR